MTTAERAGYPEPLKVRRNYRLLNGSWRFRLHGEDALQPTRVLTHEELPYEITVPYSYQSQLSGLEDDSYYPTVWYSRSFELSAKETEGRVWLRFGAVDYSAVILVNGRWVGEHVGGHSSFGFDISAFVTPGINELRVKVVDLLDPGQPRGKQSWQAPYSCWYRGSTGIWQNVWLEFTPSLAVGSFRVSADPEDRRIDIQLRPTEVAPGTARSRVFLNGALLDSAETGVCYPETRVTHRLDEVLLWAPESPVLYDIELEVVGSDGETDSVSTYCAFRSLAVAEGMLLLNGQPVYQRLILDQGFWPDGHYTAPGTEALRADIELAKSMGFNGCRKHVKAEDPRFYFWADVLGYMVWAEFPSPYLLNTEVKFRVITELGELIERDRQHPSIIAWTLYNESWGLPDLEGDRSGQQWLRSLVSYVRALDPTRLVVDNDGWEHVESDLYGIHSYAPDRAALESDIEQARSGGDLSWGRAFMVDRSAPPRDKPLLLTEFGGIGYRTDPGQEGWSYDNIPESPEEFRERFEALFAVVEEANLAGFVYTQLTDVEAEINGLATPDRRPKFDPGWIASVVRGTGQSRER